MGSGPNPGAERFAGEVTSVWPQRELPLETGCSVRPDFVSAQERQLLLGMASIGPTELALEIRTPCAPVSDCRLSRHSIRPDGRHLTCKPQRSRRRSTRHLFVLFIVHTGSGRIVVGVTSGGPNGVPRHPTVRNRRAGSSDFEAPAP